MLMNSIEIYIKLYKGELMRLGLIACECSQDGLNSVSTNILVGRTDRYPTADNFLHYPNYRPNIAYGIFGLIQTKPNIYTLMSEDDGSYREEWDLTLDEIVNLHKLLVHIRSNFRLKGKHLIPIHRGHLRRLSNHTFKPDVDDNMVYLIFKNQQKHFHISWLDDFIKTLNSVI